MHYALNQYQQSAQPTDADVLKRFGPLVDKIAHALSGRTGVDADDLWSAGALGLLEAIKRFDASRGVKLEAFVAYRIRGAMLDELRRMDRLPRRLRGRVARLDKARQKLQNDLGREPTRDELAAELGVEGGEVDRLEQAQGAEASLDAVGQVAADNVAPLDVLVVAREKKGELKRAIGQLPERLQTVLSLRYVEELTLKEIAGLLGVSEPRVCQLHNAAIDKLRKILAP